jgi:hypothetical protein
LAPALVLALLTFLPRRSTRWHRAQAAILLFMALIAPVRWQVAASARSRSTCRMARVRTCSWALLGKAYLITERLYPGSFAIGSQRDRGAAVRQIRKNSLPVLQLHHADDDRLRRHQPGQSAGPALAGSRSSSGSSSSPSPSSPGRSLFCDRCPAESDGAGRIDRHRRRDGAVNGAAIVPP